MTFPRTITLQSNDIHLPQSLVENDGYIFMDAADIQNIEMADSFIASLKRRVFSFNGVFPDIDYTKDVFSYNGVEFPLTYGGVVQFLDGLFGGKAAQILLYWPAQSVEHIINHFNNTAANELCRRYPALPRMKQTYDTEIENDVKSEDDCFHTVNFYMDNQRQVRASLLQHNFTVSYMSMARASEGSVLVKGDIHCDFVLRASTPVAWKFEKMIFDTPEVFEGITLRARFAKAKIDFPKYPPKPFVNAFISTFMHERFAKERDDFLEDDNIVEYTPPSRNRMIAAFFGLDGETWSDIWRNFIGYKKELNIGLKIVSTLLTTIWNVVTFIPRIPLNILKILTEFSFLGALNFCAQKAKTSKSFMGSYLWEGLEFAFKGAHFIGRAITSPFKGMKEAFSEGNKFMGGGVSGKLFGGLLVFCSAATTAVASIFVLPFIAKSIVTGLGHVFPNAMTSINNLLTNLGKWISHVGGGALKGAMLGHQTVLASTSVGATIMSGLKSLGNKIRDCFCERATVLAQNVALVENKFDFEAVEADMIRRQKSRGGDTADIYRAQYRSAGIPIPRRSGSSSSSLESSPVDSPKSSISVVYLTQPRSAAPIVVKNAVIAPTETGTVTSAAGNRI